MNLPVIRRLVSEFHRIEVIDRSVVISSQALLALVPLIVLLAVCVPWNLSELGVERFADLTGLSGAAHELATAGDGSTDYGKVQVGWIGAVIVVLTASSFSRGMMRAYEKVWDCELSDGIRARARGLAWLAVWLVALQGIALASWSLSQIGVPLGFRMAGQAVLLSALWWASTSFLLDGQVGRAALLPGAVLTGIALVAYCAVAMHVMPAKLSSSAQQFGAFGLVLGLAAWLLGIAFTVVLAAMLGRLVVPPRFRGQPEHSSSPRSAS